MSDPAYYLVGDKTYYSRSGARYTDDWLFWGPQVLVPYLRVLGPPMDTDLNDVAFGGFALFPDEKRLLWFGGEDLDCCPFYCRLYLKLMKAVWPEEWRIEWAGRGLHTLARAAGRTPPRESLHPAFREHRELYEKQFRMLGEERWSQLMTMGAVSIRYLNDEIALFPLHDGDVPESYLWVGPDEIVDALGARFPRKSLEFPSGQEEPVGTFGGFHLDFQKRVLAHWSHQANIDAIPREAWPDWTIIDWEERFEEHVKITNGKLQPVYPPLEDLLTQLERSLVAEEPSDYKVFYQTHEIYDENWNVVEEIAFPISLPERKRIWTQALQRTGLAKKPYPGNWWNTA
ncbi:MAG: hypothetical protein KC800_03960 [Candidatus Eremiobacteraeota bacterium]|nr:hypothetical protein [Candidatus Eremiobacteraeota bacterium]